MSSIFGADSSFLQLLNRIADLLFLNLIFIVCCIPIFTIGASWTALNYVLLKMARNEEGYVIRGFFKSFKENFGQATLIWLGLLVFGLLCAWGLWLLFGMGDAVPVIGYAVALVACTVLLMIIVYIFPLLARYQNTTGGILKNAFLLMCLHVPQSLLLVVLLAVPFVLIWFSTYLVIVVAMFGFSVPAFISAYLYRRIFRKFEPEQTIASDETFSVAIEGGSGEKDGETD